jgi:hypothetical protein
MTSLRLDDAPAAQDGVGRCRWIAAPLRGSR